MAATIETEPAASLLNPMFDSLLTPESATRILSYALPDDVLRRLEVLREKAGEDQLSGAERREYARLIDEMDLIALAKLKARRLLEAAAATGRVGE